MMEKKIVLDNQLLCQINSEWVELSVLLLFCSDNADAVGVVLWFGGRGFWRNQNRLYHFFD